MVLVLIFGVIKTIFSFAIRIIARLLVAFSLWVPLVYTLFFVIIAGITGASISEHSNIFWAGLIVSFVISVAVSFYRYEKRKGQKRQRRATRRGNVDGGERVVERGEADNRNFPPSCPYHVQHQAQQHQAQHQMQPPQPPIIEHELKHPSYKVYNPSGEEVMGNFEAPPRIFAVKNDPTIFICEYNDRLEYFKHTRHGMILMETKRK